jgi:hypothetical protein
MGKGLFAHGERFYSICEFGPSLGSLQGLVFNQFHLGNGFSMQSGNAAKAASTCQQAGQKGGGLPREIPGQSDLSAWGEGAEHSRKAIHRQKLETASLHLQLAKALWKNQQWKHRPLKRDELQEATRSCEECIALDPENQEAWVLLAKLYFESGEVGKAIETYSRARSLNPSLPQQLFEEIISIQWDRVKNTSLPLLGRNKSEMEIAFLGTGHPVRVSRTPAMFVDDYAQRDLADHLLKGWSISTFEDYCLSVPNARVIGFDTFLTAGNELLNDTRIQNIKGQVSWYDRVIQGIPVRGLATIRRLPGQGDNGSAGSEERYLALTTKFEEIQIDEPVFWLGSLEPDNYASWLFRFLPKLIAVEKMREYGCSGFKILVQANQQWQKNLLQLAGIGLDELVYYDQKTLYKCKHLFVPSLRNRCVFIDQETIGFYRKLCQKHGVLQKAENLIYISRLNQNTRRFVNEMELIEELEKRGFMIVQPERHDLLDQFRIFASAKMIVGPSGAGMFNCIFSPEGTTIIDIEAFPYWLNSHASLFASLGHRYGILIGEADLSDPAPVHKRWTLNVGKAMQRIDQVLASLKS